MPRRVGLVGLGEAANFGDDLILAAVVQAIAGSFPSVEILHTSFGRPVDWASLSRQLSTDLNPRAVPVGRDLPGSRGDESMFKDCDAIIFGGGGLLTTSHHPDRPYHWLRFLPRRSDVPVLAAGLGVGPLSPAWEERLRRLGLPFDECYLRDDDSVRYADAVLGWKVKRCRDFVDRVFLSQFGMTGAGGSRDSGQNILGVALRDWPGLDAEQAGRHVDTIARRLGVSEIRFYVLESPGGCGVDVEFTNRVIDATRFPQTSMRAYSGDDVAGFARDMAGCGAAVSMKLHSSALWGALGIPIFPISYAPKTAAFFGRPYRGLEVFKEPVEPVVEPSDVPRGQDVVATWLAATFERGGSTSRSTLGSAERLRFQTSTFAVNVARKAKQLTRGHIGDRPRSRAGSVA